MINRKFDLLEGIQGGGGAILKGTLPEHYVHANSHKLSQSSTGFYYFFFFFVPFGFIFVLVARFNAFEPLSEHSNFTSQKFLSEQSLSFSVEMGRVDRGEIL